MLKFSKLEPLRLYRVKDKYSLPYNQKTPLLGNLITVLAESIDDTVEFFKSPYIKFERYQRYYIEKKINTDISHQKVIVRNVQKDEFDNGFGKAYDNVRYILSPEAARGRNIIRELGQYIQLLNKNPRLAKKPLLTRSQMKFDYIISKLQNISNEFPNHNKFIYIPVDKYIDNPRNLTIWTKRSYLENFGIMFIRYLFANYSKVSANLTDWTFIFLNVNELFYINAVDLNPDTIDDIKKIFVRLRSRRNSPVITEVDDEDIVDEDDETINIANEKIIKDVSDLTVAKLADADLPEDSKEEIIEKVTEKVTNVVKPRISDTPVTVKKQEKKEDPIGVSKLASTAITGTPIEEDDDSDKNQLNNKLTSKDEVSKIVDDSMRKELLNIITPNISENRLARIAKIKSEMDNIVVDNMSIADIVNVTKSHTIDDHKINVDVINDKMKNIKFDNFERSYNEKLLEYDIVNIFKSFAEKDRPLYLLKLDKEDTSTPIDKKYTYTALYEDENGRRHTITVDIPKFVNDKFIFLNGSPKLFISQILPLPVTKTSPDQVQVSSVYNKIFITRFGKNVSSKISKFYKAFPEIDGNVISCKKGNNLSNNVKYMTTIEYDELSSKFNTIVLRDANITIYFNQDEINEICKENNLSYDAKRVIPFAIKTEPNEKKSLITLDFNKDCIDGQEGMSPIDFIINEISKVMPSFEKDFNKLPYAKKMMYTRAKIMAKDVPTILLLAFLDGLEPLLNRLKLNYIFTEKRPNRQELGTNKSMVEFKDGYLVYDAYPFSNCLLLNGLYAVPTKEYNFLEFSSKDIYYDIFAKMFGRRNIGVAFENFNQLFIDHITKEILEDYNLPTNFIDLIIYANSLLENNTFEMDGDLSLSRIRTNELVPAHLYKILAKAYEQYRATADNKNPTKFSVRKVDVINDIFESQVFEEYSTLNPIAEIERIRSTSYKGPGGCNIEQAFTLQKRAYNDSMLGILAQSSPVSANIGVSRTLSINPNVKSLRGYFNINKNNPKALDGTNMLSAAELLVPFTATKDDPQRVCMTSIQSRHTISTVDSDIPLFGYGMDKVLAKSISDTFVFKAKGDGIVAEINEKLGYMLLKYDNGDTDVVDLTERQALNTGSGFYITNKLTPVTMDVGFRFAADDVVAYNEDFFYKNEITGDIIYKSGPLARVAVIHGSCVFEDSTLFTEEFAERMSSYVTQKRQVTIGKHSNIYHMVSVGDVIKVNDPLIIFDESYQDDFINKLLSNLNSEDKADIIESARTPIASKYNGRIVDIKINYTVPKEELSPSIQKIINNYESTIKKRLKIFEDNGVNLKDMTSLNELDTYTEPVNGKVKGVKMGDNAVLIEFYIQTLDKFSVGDKCTYGTALKGINQNLIPKGEEPYLLSDPSIKIDAFMSLSGDYSRMTNSFNISMVLNSVIIGAENKIKDILEDKI